VQTQLVPYRFGYDFGIGVDNATGDRREPGASGTPTLVQDTPGGSGSFQASAELVDRRPAEVTVIYSRAAARSRHTVLVDEPVWSKNSICLSPIIVAGLCALVQGPTRNRDVT
jgi:hypothetical protein